MRFHAFFTTAGTTILGDQLAEFHIELLFLVDHPLVVIVATEGFALVLFSCSGFAEGDNVSHSGGTTIYSNVRASACCQDAWRWRRRAADISTLNSRSARQIFCTSPGPDHNPIPSPAR